MNVGNLVYAGFYPLCWGSDHVLLFKKNSHGTLQGQPCRARLDSKCEALSCEAIFCHKPTMTGDGLNPTHENGDGLGMVYDIEVAKKNGLFEWDSPLR